MLAFEYVARSGSVRAAADGLSVTPGAVSRQICLLEDYFGTALFQRQRRGLVLTLPDNAYFLQITPHLNGIRQVSSATLQRNADRTVIRLHSFTMFATRWLIPRLSQFQLSYPAIEVRLTTASEWDDTVDCDAEIRLGDGTWPQQHATQLAKNVLVPVCRPTADRRESMHLAGLAQHTLLLVRGV